MAIKYTTAMLKNPHDPDAPKKAYARAKSVKQDNIETLAEKISQDTTINEEDCLICLDAIMKQVVEGLKAGKIVKINRFGTFRLTVVNEGGNCPELTEYLADNAKFVASSAIKGVNIIFTPDKNIKNLVNAATIEKYAEVEESPSIKRARNPQEGEGTV